MGKTDGKITVKLNRSGLKRLKGNSDFPKSMLDKLDGGELDIDGELRIEDAIEELSGLVLSNDFSIEIDHERVFIGHIVSPGDKVKLTYNGK